VIRNSHAVYCMLLFPSLVLYIRFLFCIGLFYYTLGNIRPHLRSTLRAIQLIACVTCDNIKKYGFEKILQPFIDDVNTLSEVSLSISYTYDPYGCA